MPPQVGKVFVVSAPSGTGKTTLNRRLCREYEKIELAISHTTRPRRPEEESGKDYHFVTVSDFQQLVEDGDMLEHAEVFGQLYGTSHGEVRRITSQGRIALLEIDVQGWLAIHRRLVEAQSVFVIPPSMKNLWLRLKSRGSDSYDVCWRRFMAAKQEILASNNYDFFIINDDLEDAYRQLSALVAEGQVPILSKAEGEAACQTLLQEIENSSLLADLRREWGEGS